MKYDFQRLKDWMDGVCQKKYTPCCDVMIYQDHKEVFRYLTGTTDLEGQHPVSPQTVYYLYSCTNFNGQHQTPAGTDHGHTGCFRSSARSTRDL